MSKPVGKHPDGSNCYTKNCSRMVNVSTGSGVVGSRSVQVEVLASLLPEPGSVRKGLNSSGGVDRLEGLHQATDEFFEGLTVPERNLLARYKHTNFRFVNDFLNGGASFIRDHYLKRKGKVLDAAEAEEFAGHAVKMVPELDRVLSKWSPAVPAHQVLYRAFTVYPPKFKGGETDAGSAGFVKDYVRENYAVGAVVTSPAYSSTSADSDYMLVADGESSAPVIVHEIVSSKGVPVFRRFRPGSRAIQNAEKEVLIPRGARFQVVNVSEETFESSYPEGERLPFEVWGEVVRKKKFVVVQLVQL